MDHEGLEEFNNILRMVGLSWESGKDDVLTYEMKASLEL
jgi:hypothetical protein